jgi:hypothetical protein
MRSYLFEENEKKSPNSRLTGGTQILKKKEKEDKGIRNDV